ncbi:FAD-dependent oxidoreductase [Thioclava litoralis]|uniref:FAD-dependent oxidoreductase n=1 Tax=Thioclava litoralis TaxID=3076557 RepID=A0ABZ1DXN3_9RHOB|nr:FAD-dependent oxidoreductase [Thioclava sp. FTW29]
MSGIVIIGAGQAAASLAAKLRTEGYEGAVTIIGEEPVAPYQRPPLSKAYLLGEMPLERLTLRSPEFWAEQNITLKLGTRVDRIDPAAKRVRMAGEVLGYDQLALCTGADPKRLAPALGGDLGNLFTIRNLADIDALEPQMVAGKRLVVIGGGYIGLETAAVARKLGLEVTLVQASERILRRVACRETADAVRALHQSEGVTILEGTSLRELRGDGMVDSVELVDGTVLPADLVVVGIGVTPATRLAEEAGLVLGDGIVTDSQGRTSDPHIWSAGDCAEINLNGARMRLESVGNAIDMGELVACNMLGAGKDYQPKPWFWSDMFASKLQIAGWNGGYTRVIAKNVDGQSFWYFRDDQLIAVDALDAPRAYMVGKRLIEAGSDVTPAEVEAAVDLKSLMRR